MDAYRSTYSQSSNVLPPNGGQQCLWTAGYSQGTTSITLKNCGATNASPPSANQMLILDQVNDLTDNGGDYICDVTTDNGTNCTLSGGPQMTNAAGRVIYQPYAAGSSIAHSQQQVVWVKSVSGPDGSGNYTVNITPGVYFNNIRTHSEWDSVTSPGNYYPGAWWSAMVQNEGLENLTVDHSQTTDDTPILLYDCYQCWVKNVRSLNAARANILIRQSMSPVIRDNYLYGAQTGGNQSYGVETWETSGVLIENNIIQQATEPVIFGQYSGSVVGYNYTVRHGFNASSVVALGNYSHGSAAGMNLWEGNVMAGVQSDLWWGSNDLGTFFRNMLSGWQSTKTVGTVPINLNSYARSFNAIGNVLGQPSYHSSYESYATSISGGVNFGNADASIYTLGTTGNTGTASCAGSQGPLCTPPSTNCMCDSVVRRTLMRWGNYDTVTSATKWDFTEASPAAVPYVNANFTSGYFGSLAHTLPPSLYYSSKPSWWPAAKAWPPIGPDVSTGNLGVCSGTYSGAQATASGQCTGGALTGAWAAHANAIPAQDCYLNVMKGPPDGTGNVLNFDANLCYASYGTRPAPTTNLVVTKID
jgi:hypothetical protein